MIKPNNNPSPLLICGGRIIDPSQGIDLVGNLLVDEGKIVQVGSTVIASEAKQPQAIDAAGLIVCPGFVDIHCHLREPGFADKETIATGTKAAAKGGFTTVCCMANTNPPIDNRDVVNWIKQEAKKNGFVNVLPIGCITKARGGEEICEMAELAEAGVVGFSDDGDSVANSLVMRHAMEHSRNLDLPVIDHCEDKRFTGSGVINEGRLSAELGLIGMPAVAEEIMVARDIALAKLTGARVHIAHVSTCGSVESIRQAKDKGISVTAEVTPHHLTLTEESIIGKERDKNNDVIASVAKQSQYNTNAKVNPPLRTKQDIEALIEGLKDGVIDAIATDHAPHTLADKDCKLELAAFGISGFETAFGCLMSLVHKGEISLSTLIYRLTHGPAKIIGKGSEMGTLKVGVPANITIFDPALEWTVDSRDFVSKGKNTPFDGYKFKGKVMSTIVNGKIVYMDDFLKRRCQSHIHHSEPKPQAKAHPDFTRQRRSKPKGGGEASHA